MWNVHHVCNDRSGSQVFQQLSYSRPNLSLREPSIPATTLGLLSLKESSIPTAIGTLGLLSPLGSQVFQQLL